ncbi:4,5-DOPA dioxygenase extradiol [Tahibacter amnicola]|uniref:4,5-DOPA dioxygenase extradiol n=1 Tax=Tahibacter amnicola TaxID=2976241 RepID=A0ABY6BLF8_9GAMM|nr:4,5-DOPA dioxygenase extradiol [Tahibacter amnicola]UXI70622.1 4,5-DOPA dioxygenase extradiol [Tahibacter amnicola]
MPVLFIGHGSPMNAITDNYWSRALRELGRQLPVPRAILVVSAHWYESGSFVTAQAAPETLRDFGGFPPALYEMRYPAPGDPALARQVVALTGGRVDATTEWGLDHGSWSVLCHLFPEAAVPVVQLSLDMRLAPRDHVELGRQLSPLRDDGVLILASGNLVHNLAHALRAHRNGDICTPDWAQRFDTAAAAALQNGDQDFLLCALGSVDGRQAHPTPDHFLPLLYAVGAARADDALDFPVTGFDMGSISMRSVRFARAA